MAIKLRKTEIGQQSDLVNSLREAIELFQAGQAEAEKDPSKRDDLTDLGAKLLVAINEAEEFRDDVASRLRDEFDAKSEKWMESDAGETASAFVDEWEAVEFDTPDLTEDLVTLEIDETMPDTLEELPEAPE